MNYKRRLEQLRLLLASLPCDGLLIEYPVDLLYLTGLELSTGKLLVSCDQAALLVDGRYVEICSRQSLYPVILSNHETLKEQLSQLQIRRLGFDQAHCSYQNFLALVQFAKELSIEVLPTESATEKLRIIKDEDEIEALRAAAELGCQGFRFAASLLAEGISEAEVALELEFFWKKRGAKRLAFDSIVAFGPNSSMPHYRSGPQRLKNHEPVLIDIGVVLSHYHSDMTRVVYFGTPPPLIETIYTIVEEAKEKAFTLCRPGTLIGELDQIARGHIASKGYAESFSHSLGHGIGLDIHEPPIIRSTGAFSDRPLQPGMVLTIEPGIYLPGIGGVRLEDTILITENGYENLTLKYL
jgi:Xaa-Pro aminopeptidase